MPPLPFSRRAASGGHPAEAGRGQDLDNFRRHASVVGAPPSCHPAGGAAPDSRPSPRTTLSLTARANGSSCLARSPSCPSTTSADRPCTADQAQRASSSGCPARTTPAVWQSRMAPMRLRPAMHRLPRPGRAGQRAGCPVAHPAQRTSRGASSSTSRPRATSRRPTRTSSGWCPTAFRPARCRTSAISSRRPRSAPWWTT
jgi:hypothetical protein